MYLVQVFNKQTGKYQSLRPSKGDLYRFLTRDAAYECAKLCYPDQMRIDNGLGVIRIVPESECEDVAPDPQPICEGKTNDPVYDLCPDST